MKLKYLLIIAMAALLPAIFNANAQYVPITPLSGYIVSAAGTSNNLFVIDVPNQSTVAIEWTNPTGGSTNLTMHLGRSVTGSSYQTNWWVIPGPTAGTTLVTNLSVPGFGYVRCDAIVSVGTIASTNTVSWAVKKGL